MDELGQENLGASLQELGWAFRFDRAKRRLGACKGGKTKVISLSRYYVQEKGWEVMEDVARHEIAHALDYETRGCSDHSNAWKRWARRCGADPTRLYQGEPLTPEASKYVGTCPSCGNEYPYHRRLRRSHACVACCRQYADGRYDARFCLTVSERVSGRVMEPLEQAMRLGAGH